MNAKMKAEYDFGNAKRATQIPHLNRLREQHSEQLLDDDVQSWLLAQDSATKHYISQMIRQVIAMQKLVH